ncbi:uncharacterized protein At3g06530-like [Salvia miltiorrhiza]|uniref:uncharacterized protein At3g06530-like n=1 Tax=Salvia miltiorrhiza TaxID=226208 RepID=UPI0025AD72C2|nr:uncharacterized protein At3g06530-like [Salvia miltiorrhiza]
MEERFRNYKNDLFSFQSKELDRELVGQEENKRINASLGSYLRLLSGYLELHSALKTLEYLIRRYKIHVYNAEDLILCALPYHDTHVFVQIIRLIDAGNSRWKFLDGVKESGARPPREVIVQHCVRDMGILETICNYVRLFWAYDFLISKLCSYHDYLKAYLIGDYFVPSACWVSSGRWVSSGAGTQRALASWISIPELSPKFFENQ